jgi:hypothetical protein
VVKNEIKKKGPMWKGALAIGAGITVAIAIVGSTLNSDHPNYFLSVIYISLV